MTFIEFFNGTDSENIISCLTCVPDRVIIFGNDSDLMEKRKNKYAKVFSDRGHNIEFIVKSAPKNRLDIVIQKLTETVNTYDDCVFDITGGDELLILGLGMVYCANRDKNIQIHKINIESNVIYDCDMDGKTVYRDAPALSVEENIRIFGGDVIYGSVDEEKTYQWDLTPDFLRDVELIWNICKRDPGYWNTQIGVFDVLNSIGNVSEDGVTLSARMIPLENELKRRKAKYIKAPGIIADLMKKGLITQFDDEDGESIKVGFKNPQVKRCLTKAGMALEIKVFAMVKPLCDNRGQLVYNDALNGVAIDWDGVCHNEQCEHIYDTENEVDILLMHNAVPIFVSCKNGNFSAEELYKLNTVANRFGGKYALKVLIATTLDNMKETGCYIRQRAKDMDIKVIDDLHRLDDKRILERLNALWKKG